MKARRSFCIGSEKMVVVLTLCLFNFAFNHVTLEFRQMVDEQDAVQMVNLMLDALAEQVLGLQLLQFPRPIKIGHTNTLGACDVSVLTGDGQTPFIIGEGSLRIAPDNL